MKRKIVSILLSAILVLGAVSLSACANSELEAKIADLQAQITELQDQNEDLQANVTQQQAQIEELQQENQELEEFVESTTIKSISIKSRIIKEIEVSNMIELNYWFFTSGVPNNRITLYSSIENVVFECVVDKGKFGFGSEVIQQTTVSPNETIYWDDNYEDIDQAFIEIALKHEDNYIGYAIIKIITEDRYNYIPTILKSAIFPKVNGEYQIVSKEEVQIVINRHKIIGMQNG